MKVLTGVEPSDVGLDDEADPDTALDAAIQGWLDDVSARIDEMLGSRSPVGSGDDIRPAIDGVAERTVANILAYARSVRETAYASVNEFRVQIFDASNATKSLRRELSSFLTSSPSVTLFTSMTDEELEDSIYGDTPGGTMSTA